MKKILFLVSILLVIGACTDLETRAQREAGQVVSLQQISKKDYVLTNVFPNKGLTLGFDTEGRIFGYSGLNRFFGKAKIVGDTIKIEKLASTKMSGAQDAWIRENEYLTLLNSMTKIVMKKNVLILSNEKGETLEFVPEGSELLKKK